LCLFQQLNVINRLPVGHVLHLNKRTRMRFVTSVANIFWI
jgi:hypothetical protein